MPMLLDILKKIPLDRQTDENGKIYDDSFVDGYNSEIMPIFKTEETIKKFIYQTATKSFLGFFINGSKYDEMYFKQIGNDAGGRYRAWEIITQTPDAFADYFEKYTVQNADADNKADEKQGTIIPVPTRFSKSMNMDKAKGLFSLLLNKGYIDPETKEDCFLYWIGITDEMPELLRPINWTQAASTLKDISAFVNEFYPNEPSKWVKAVTAFTHNKEMINKDSLKTANSTYDSDPISKIVFKEFNKPPLDRTGYGKVTVRL
jgi:hypothetical protein